MTGNPTPRHCPGWVGGWCFALPSDIRLHRSFSLNHTHSTQTPILASSRQPKPMPPHLVLQGLDDGAVGVDLQNAAATHVLRLLLVAQRLCMGREDCVCGVGVASMSGVTEATLGSHSGQGRPRGKCALNEAVPPTCARAMRSMLVDQPNLESTTMAGESVRRLEVTTFSTLSPRTWGEGIGSTVRLACPGLERPAQLARMQSVGPTPRKRVRPADGPALHTRPLPPTLAMNAVRSLSSASASAAFCLPSSLSSSSRSSRVTSVKGLPS